MRDLPFGTHSNKAINSSHVNYRNYSSIDSIDTGNSSSSSSTTSRRSPSSSSSVGSFGDWDTDIIHERIEQKSKRQFVYLTMLAIILSFSLTGYLLGSKYGSSQFFSSDQTEVDVLSYSSYQDATISSATTISKDNAGSSVPTIAYYNEYTKSRPLSGDYPWDDIVEPFRITYFEVTNAVEDCYYEWYIEGYHHTTGSLALVTFVDDPGTYQTITLKQRKSSSGEIVGSSSLTVIIKYVRRELRSLLDQDREAFFQAVSIMQRVPTQVGKKIYGDAYRSRDFFNRIHLYWGGSRDCDHWHQGPGFVTSHITYSRMYEQSLQSIYPSVSLPYWDFTLESTFYTPETFRSSGVFSSDWFGDADCENDLHTPMTGRFAYVPVMEFATNYSRIVSPFGMLRSPWNVDPIPYMSRSNQIFGLDNNLKPSGCSEYHHALGFDDWKGLWRQLNANTHGHVHELMGGSWNYNTAIRQPTSTQGQSNAFEFAHATEAYSKVLWRYGYLECPGGYGAGTINQNGETIENFDEEINTLTLERCWKNHESEELWETDCACKCNADKFPNQTIADILSETGIIHSLVFFDKQGEPIETLMNESSRRAYSQLPGYTQEETDDIYAEIMTVLCDPGYMGDMFQATSPNDVTFWVIHPNLERVWHLIRLNTYKGLMDFDDTWPDSEVTCDGHYSFNPQPFKNVFDNNDQIYTNEELYDILDPSQDEYPYIFDNFDWSHCLFLGYDMSGLPDKR